MNGSNVWGCTTVSPAREYTWQLGFPDLSGEPTVVHGRPIAACTPWPRPLLFPVQDVEAAAVFQSAGTDLVGPAVRRRLSEVLLVDTNAAPSTASGGSVAGRTAGGERIPGGPSARRSLGGNELLAPRCPSVGAVGGGCRGQGAEQPGGLRGALVGLPCPRVCGPQQLHVGQDCGSCCFRGYKPVTLKPLLFARLTPPGLAVYPALQTTRARSC